MQKIILLFGISLFLSSCAMGPKMSYHRVVSGLIFDRSGKLLVVKRARHYSDLESGKGKWDFPGGKAQVGEDFKSALLKEIKQETGYQINDWKLVSAKNIVLKTEKKWASRVHIFYRMRLKTKDDSMPPKLTDEHSEYKWVDMETFKKLEMVDEKYREAALENWSSKRRR